MPRRFESDGEPVVRLDNGDVYILGLDLDSWEPAQSDLIDLPSTTAARAEWPEIGPNAQAQLEAWGA